MNAKVRTWTVAGLLGGAIGLVVQQVGGMDMPVVPPGMVLLVVAACLMLIKRLRWAPIVAVLAGAAELAGFFGSGAYSWLVKSGEPVGMTGTWLRLVGVSVAVIAGVLAAKAAYRRSPRPSQA
jgi:hypothetical protein